MSPDRADLPAGVALSVEGLTKRETLVHEARYTPTISIGSRIRNRRSGTPFPLGPSAELGGDEEDDDDDGGDDDDEQDEGEPFELDDRGSFRSEWLLRDVTFEVARGEAVAAVGDARSVATLAQVLSGMTAPSAGRAIYRGRIGLSSRLAWVLARRTIADPRVTTRVLARVAGVPRRRRKEWGRAVLALVSGEQAGAEVAPVTARQVRTRIPLAAALDPFADILVVDDVPRRSDVAFLERCLEQLRQRLDEGAAVVVACPDPGPFAALCRRAVLLEGGVVTRTGAAEEIVSARRREAERERLTGGSERAFNADAAIISAALTTVDGEPVSGLDPDEELRVSVRFETSNPDTSVSWRILVSGPATESVQQRKPSVLDAPGAYVATLRLPPTAGGEGEYELAVEARVAVAGRRSVVSRALPGRYRRESAWLAETVVDTDGLVAEWSLIDDLGDPD